MAPEAPPHGTTCPYCKEEVHVEAIKRKHCGSSLAARSPAGCDCEQQSGQQQTLMAMRPSVNPRGPGLGGLEPKCFFRIRCQSVGFIHVCWIEQCCFSETQGKWDCIET